MNESCPQSAPQADPAPAAAALTCDGFLGGRIRLWQPRRGYRAGVDPVLLAAAVTARPGEAVLDLGCGAGAAVLCLAARVSGLRLAGVEIQPFYADLARRNAEANGIALEVLEADLAAPRGLAAGAFDHAIANPPYYRAENGPAPADAGRAAAFAETQGLAVWTAAARRALRQGGVLTVIQHTERLPELLGALDRFGSVAVLPIAGRTSRPAERVLVRAVKGGRGAFRLLTPLVLHHGFGTAPKTTAMRPVSRRCCAMVRRSARALHTHSAKSVTRRARCAELLSRVVEPNRRKHMTLSSHLQELRKKHQTLSDKVEAAQRSPAADDLYLTELKKQKLRLKEEINRLSTG